MSDEKLSGGPRLAESASDIQQVLMTALRNSHDLKQEPDDFLERLLSKRSYTEDALSNAISAIYKRVYYSASCDLEIDPTEQRRISELIRLLRLDDDRVAALNYQVGLSLYRRSFRDAVSDGCLSTDEDSALKAIADFFGLRKRDINRTIGDQALAYYSFLLTEAVRDNLLDDEEMERLAYVAQRYQLSTRQLSSISVPQKKEVLRTALASIKASGSIDESDREHIRSLARFLNAQNLLKPCLMDLDLYEKIFTIRQGSLPTIDADSLILEAGEKLHQKVSVIYAQQRAGKVKRRKGTLYVGSFRIRFVGLKQSHEIRYKNILQLNLKEVQVPRIVINVSSGRGGGEYLLAKASDPGALVVLKELLAFLVRKSRGLERGGRDSAYVSDEVKREVWYRDGGRCVICEAKEYLEFDHIIPRAKGGATTIDNLQILCRKCNMEKSDRI